MSYEDIIRCFNIDTVRELLNGYADAVYLSKTRSERYNAVIGYALHGDHNGEKGTKGSIYEKLRCVDVMQRTRHLFDLYMCPASLAPDITSDDMVKIFDNGVTVNDTDIVIPFNDDIMNIDSLIRTYVDGCMLERKMIDRKTAIDCISIQERATDDGNRHNRIFWRYVLETLDDEMLCRFLKSNLPTLQTFAITSPFCAYPYTDCQLNIINRYVMRYAKERTFSYLEGDPFSDWRN